MYMYMCKYKLQESTKNVKTKRLKIWRILPVHYEPKLRNYSSLKLLSTS